MSEKRELKETLLFEKNHRIHGGIYHKMQVDFAYNSNHIEGSRLTHEQTCYIFETQSVDGAVFVNDVLKRRIISGVWTGCWTPFPNRCRRNT